MLTFPKSNLNWKGQLVYLNCQSCLLSNKIVWGDLSHSCISHKCFKHQLTTYNWYTYMQHKWTMFILDWVFFIIIGVLINKILGFVELKTMCPEKQMWIKMPFSSHNSFYTEKLCFFPASSIICNFHNRNNTTINPVWERCYCSRY